MKQTFFPIWDGELLHIGQAFVDVKGDYLGGWSTACGMPYPTQLHRPKEATAPTCLACIALAPAHATVTE